MSAKRKMTRREQQRKDKRQRRLASARPRYDLYLDKQKDEDFAVFETVEALLLRNKFHTVARRGILIEAALQAGDIDILLHYHPQVLELVKAKLPAPKPPDLTEIAKAVVDEMELRGVVYKNEAPPIVASPGLKPIPGAKQLAPPTFDEDEDVVILRKDESAGADIAANFLNAAFGINDQVH